MPMIYKGIGEKERYAKAREALKIVGLENKENNINIDEVVCHAPYIVNLGNKKDESKYEFSIENEYLVITEKCYSVFSNRYLGDDKIYLHIEPFTCKAYYPLYFFY